MLSGSLKVTVDNHIFEYDITAVDYPSEFKMLIKTNSYRAINYMSHSNYEEEDVHSLWERRVDVKTAKVVVETIQALNTAYAEFELATLQNDEAGIFPLPAGSHLSYGLLRTEDQCRQHQSGGTECRC